MKSLSFNTNNLKTESTNKDVLSVFKKNEEKEILSYETMSTAEISEVVSEKIINSVKKQFEKIKDQFENNKKNTN